MSFEPDRKLPEPVEALQSQVRPLPVHHWSWYRTTLFSLFSFPSLESCGSPSCPNSDSGSAALCSPGFGDCSLKFQGILKTDARKTSRVLYYIQKEHRVPTCTSHIFLAVTEFAPCFQGIVLCCSSGAAQLPQALLKCRCFWGETEWLLGQQGMLLPWAVLLQELQLETELGKLQQLLPWPLPLPSAPLDYSNVVKMFNPIFPLARGGKMPWKILFKGGSGVALQPWE